MAQIENNSVNKETGARRENGGASGEQANLLRAEVIRGDG